MKHTCACFGHGSRLQLLLGHVAGRPLGRRRGRCIHLRQLRPLYVPCTPQVIKPCPWRGLLSSAAALTEAALMGAGK